jgi:hypothetical protein
MGQTLRDCALPDAQGFINESFRNISSTEYALNLLQQFESILQRDTLKVGIPTQINPLGYPFCQFA